jgi:RNA-directed DNA polymerase
MCYWKQWRYVRTKIRNLLKLGTHPGVAIPMSLSRKGPWRCARTLATQTGMIPILSGLKDQGLMSVKELWVNIHYPATAR